VPSRLDRHGELLAIRKRFLDRLTDGDPRVAGRMTESRARRLHAAQSHTYRGEIPSNRDPLEPAGGRPTSGDRCCHLGAGGVYSERTDPG
jgi:hypothetical protein